MRLKIDSNYNLEKLRLYQNINFTWTEWPKKRLGVTNGWLTTLYHYMLRYLNLLVPLINLNTYYTEI